MLTKRIIPCLDIKDGRTVKGVNFVELRDAGDPVALAKLYSEQGADELVFLDITATVDKRKTLVDLVTQVAKEVRIPFTVGGGIGSVEDVYSLLAAGADKISINSAAVAQPELVIPGIIFTEATISYLGLGLQGLPSLGVALSEAQNYLSTSPYLIGWGSVIISILMISFNLFGNGLRDAFNPSLKGVDQ